jgi:hypothetical protein
MRTSSRPSSVPGLPAGGIVEVRRFGRPDDSWPTLVLANRSDIDLDHQVTAPGATWLDYRLVERERMRLAMSGVGQEVRNAMEARTEHLATDGVVRRQGPRIVPQHDLLPTLRRRELDAAGANLSDEIGVPYSSACSRRAGRRYLPPAPHAELRPLRADRQRPGIRALVVHRARSWSRTRDDG